MKGFENDFYRFMLLVAVAVSILILIVSFKWPRVARILFFILFSWACFMNWKTCHENPLAYLEYAELTWSDFYKDFINGWFSQHIKSVVEIISICQGLIAISMLTGGWLFRIGAIGATAFLLAIVPFGVGSGFPSTLLMAAAMFVILRKHSDLAIWRHFKASQKTLHSIFHKHEKV